MAQPILIPLLNPNEPEALLASLLITEGQKVRRGEPIGALETTKSTAEVVAEADGFILGLQRQPGDSVMAGEVLCYLADSIDESIELISAGSTQTTGTKDADLEETPVGVRISRPALALARQYGLDISQFPADQFITEAHVLAKVENRILSTGTIQPEQAFDPTAVVVYGGGGHRKAVIELLRALGCYRLVGIIDDAIPVGESLLGLPFLGSGDNLPKLYNQGIRLSVNAVGGIGNLSIRIRVFERLVQAGFTCPAVLHPRAFAEASASLSAGAQIFPQAYIGSDARLGRGCIVNTGAIISHDCVLEDYVNISPGAILAGEVEVGRGALIGMGATINLRVKIGAGARIGNGATVKSSVPAQGLVRAGAVWPD